VSCRFKRLELPFFFQSNMPSLASNSHSKAQNWRCRRLCTWRPFGPYDTLAESPFQGAFSRAARCCNRPGLRSGQHETCHGLPLSGATWNHKHMSSDCDMGGLVRKLLTSNVHSCRGTVQQRKIAFTDVLALRLVVVRLVVQILEPPLNSPACLGYEGAGSGLRLIFQAHMQM